MKVYQPSNTNIDNHIDTIKQSIKDDVGSVLGIYSSKPSGFFAVPRLLFPEIDGLGSYLTGKPKDTALNIITFLKQVSAKIDSRYAKYAVFITLVYRHGLLHQHTPKEFTYRKKDIGWAFLINSPNNPMDVQRKYHLRFYSNHLQIDVNVFYNDILESIEIIRTMIKNEFREKYISSIESQINPLNKTQILKNKSYSKFIKQSDFDFFKELSK